MATEINYGPVQVSDDANVTAKIFTTPTIHEVITAEILDKAGKARSGSHEWIINEDRTISGAVVVALQTGYQNSKKEVKDTTIFLLSSEEYDRPIAMLYSKKLFKQFVSNGAIVERSGDYHFTDTKLKIQFFANKSPVIMKMVTVGGSAPTIVSVSSLSGADLGKAKKNAGVTRKSDIIGKTGSDGTVYVA